MKKAILVLIALCVIPAMTTAAEKKVVAPVELASVGFAPTLASNAPEVEIPTAEEVAATCTHAYSNCMQAGGAFRAQCETLRGDCLSPR